MITSVKIQNFKNIRAQEIALEPLTVFVGPNGSGKTTVLEAIDLAVRAVAGIAEDVFVSERHCDWLYTRGGLGTLSISCGTEAGGFSVEALPPTDFPPPSDRLGMTSWKIAGGWDDDDSLRDAVRAARSLVYLRLNSAKLVRASYSDQGTPRVGFDGEGLASVLAYLALNNPDAFEELNSHLRKLIPSLKRIRFRKVPVERIEGELIRFGDESMERKMKRTYQGETVIFDFTNAENVAAHTVSEGTLILLGLLTVLLGPNRPNLLLLDDIEHGLHPLAQKSLLGVLRQLMERFPTLQIIATAHSPYLLDHLRPEEIRLMTLDADGYAVCGRLNDHPQFEKWKDEMTPGELWSMFGEKWLVEGGAAK